MSKIVRLTLFKIPDPAHIQEVLKLYTTLTQDAVKDGNPYIQAAAAHATRDEPRRQGVTIVARTEFASIEDMNYYDNDCAAHVEIKKILKPKLTEPPVTLIMDV